MAMKLSPELLVTRYLQSAMNGKKLSLRLRRILTLVIIPIWLLGLFQVFVLSEDAVSAIPKYRAIQEFKKGPFNHDYDDGNSYGGHVHRSWYGDGETSHQCNFNSPFWGEFGLYNTSHFDSVKGLVAIAESNQEARLTQFFSLPMFLLVLVLVPWLIIRTIYWVLDAKEQNQV